MDQRERDNYEIRVEGWLEAYWVEWFDGLSIEREEQPGVSLLRLGAADLSTLHGVLAQIGSLNLRLVSVVRKDHQPPLSEEKG